MATNIRGREHTPQENEEISHVLACYFLHFQEKFLRFAERNILNTEQNVFRACNECLSGGQSVLCLYSKDDVSALS